MSTRSAVGIWVNIPNGEVDATYVHSDGYPSGVGKSIYQLIQKGMNPNQLFETLSSNKVGWSSICGDDMRLPPQWSDYGINKEGAGVTHIRQRTSKRLSRMLEHFVDYGEDKPFPIPHKEIAEELTKHDEYLEKMAFQGKSDIPNEIKVIIHDDETYEVVEEQIFTQDHPSFGFAKYFFYFSPQSYYERGEDGAVKFRSLSDFQDSDTEYVYLYDMNNRSLWIYNNPWGETIDAQNPLLIINIDDGFDGDWEEIENGKYQRKVQLP